MCPPPVVLPRELNQGPLAERLPNGGGIAREGQFNDVRETLTPCYRGLEKGGESMREFAGAVRPMPPAKYRQKEYRDRPERPRMNNGRVSLPAMIAIAHQPPGFVTV